MIALNTPETRDVLLDALTDPQVSDHLKYMILQAMTAAYGFKPYDADIGGRLVRLAAGATTQRQGDGEEIQTVVQAAVDALAPDFPQAPKCFCRCISLCWNRAACLIDVNSRRALRRLNICFTGYPEEKSICGGLQQKTAYPPDFAA